MEERDPNFFEIRDLFLKFVEDFHRENDYERVPEVVSSKLGLTIREVQHSQEGNTFTLNDEKICLIETELPKARKRFTIWHEISHELFARASEGDLKAFLRDQNSDEKARSLEENLCDAGAALLLMPHPVYIRSLDRTGYSPLTVFELAEQTGASVNAAMRRLIYAHQTEIHAVWFELHTGLILDAVAHGAKRGKYFIKPDFSISPQHPLRTSGYSHCDEERFSANVPFRNPSTQWTSKVVASARGQRVLAFFLDSFPPDPKVQQFTLNLFT